MRRGLAFTSLFLLIAGMELATEGISLVFARLRTGLGALLTGTEFHVSGLRFGVGLGALILGLAIWVLLIWSAHRRDDVATVGTICPQCGNPTRRVKRKEWQRLLSTVLGERLTRRRCETCGWSGLSLRN
ncbi:MAG: zinc ribbon domain-containing protein [Longimicrobiales bacterium]|nr:zinc ribbon domain-containing protein [Longimicrobiales bacterium]